MKQSLKQKQNLSLNLTLSLQKQIELLSLSGLEIRFNLDDLIAEFCKESKHKKVNFFRDEVLSERVRNAINPDIRNDSFENQISLDKDLRENLMEQLHISPLTGHEALIGEIE